MKRRLDKMKNWFQSKIWGSPEFTLIALLLLAELVIILLAALLAYVGMISIQAVKILTGFVFGYDLATIFMFKIFTNRN